MFKRVAALLSLMLVMFFCTSCLKGSQEIPYSGTLDGKEYFYMESDKLLVLKGEGVIPKNWKLLGFPFMKEVEQIYFTSGFEQIDEEAFSSVSSLKTVYFEGTPTLREQAFSTSVKIETEVSDFEKRLMKNGLPLGHLVSSTNEYCLLCNEKISYKFDKMRVLLKINKELLKNKRVYVENQELIFDENGYLSNEGFLILEGKKRYIKDSVMQTGTMDAEGNRYSFNANGELQSVQKLDTEVSPASIAVIVCSVPLGILLVYMIYKFYVRQSRG